MALVLEIEFLAGFCAAATRPDNETAEWPPAADRVFSALVASWAARGCDAAEAAALDWLEAASPPAILASPAHQRTTPIFYVPPNDPRLSRSQTRKGVMPALRSRYPRRFAVARPEAPMVELHWEAEPEPATLDALDRLAADTAYVGASRSLVRCRFHLARAAPELAPVTRWVYPGRRAELVRDFERGFRPRPGVPVPRPRPGSAEPAPGSLFGTHWLLLEHRRGRMPDLRASALVARQIRDCIMSGYGRSGVAVPEVVSGHAADGSPIRAPHLAIVPLAFVGFPHADGRVLGFALVPPRDAPILDDPDFRAVLRRLAPIDPEEAERELTVSTPRGTPPAAAFQLGFTLGFEAAGRRSLDPEPYLRPSRRFATVTPIVLDRHLKSRGEDREQEIRAAIEVACGRIGLPAPRAVLVDRHAAVEGAPSVRVGGTPDWVRWRVPAELASRQLTHAVLEFAEPVAGPVLLGAGRFCGLGLCRAVP